MQRWPHLTDRELWERGDPDAFGELFARHARAVHSFCWRWTSDASLAEDLTSVVFLQAWAKRSSTTLETTSALPWLLTVALGVTRNATRSRRRHRAALARIPADPPTPDPAAEVVERLAAAQRATAARAAIEALPRGEQEVVALVLWGGQSYADAALALGVPIGTIRSRLSRARTQLRLDLAELALQDS